MIEIVPAHKEHFKFLQVVPEQLDEYRALWEPGYLDGLLSGVAFTAWASGVCLGASGILKLPKWPQRGECWAMLGSEARYHMRPIVRFMRYMADTLPERRLDMFVRGGNASGMKLAKLAGFEYEATLEGYHPLGDDVLVYKRIKR